MFWAYIDPGNGFIISNLGAWLIALIIGFSGIFLSFFKGIFKFLGKHRKTSTLSISILLISGLTIGGLFMYNKRPGFDKKIIILGFDGLSPDIIENMMKENKLPNFFRLKQQGSYAHLSTTNPSQSPVAWTGFATGQNPGKNGIYDFIIRDPRTYRLSLSISDIETAGPKKVINSKTFWQYATEKGIPSVIINCPLTFPPDRLNGKMISGMGVPDILGTEGTFSFYTSEKPDKNKDIGGKVFEVNKSDRMALELIGPRFKNIMGKVKNSMVPFAVSLKNNDAVSIKYENTEFELKKGQWSGWKEVNFKLGLLKNAKGIFKFYLVETRPEFKLYASPINFDPRKPLFKISYPDGYSKYLADNIGLFHTQGMPMDTWSVNENRLTEKAFLEQSDEILKEKESILDLELKSFKQGIIFSYFETPDIIQHMFWRYIDQEHPLYRQNTSQEYRGVIEDCYKKMDDIVGRVMEKINAEDTLIVLSDHGFGTFRRTAHINSWLRENGYLELKNPDAVSGKELLEDVDWSRTKAYAIGFGSIYINQKGREKNGIVNPGTETNMLKKEITQKLKLWFDDKYKKPVINNVYLGENIFHGKYSGKMPDIYLGFNIGYRASWQTALGGQPNGLIEDNLKKWSGDHLFDPVLIPGILFCNKRINKNNPSIYDITPTILKIIGLDDKNLKRCNLDGTPLF